jgi:ribosomal protein S6--L-glutamate ligase
MDHPIRQQKYPLQSAKPVSIGWYEWCALPDLHLPAIKAKIDTGAKTSALHAENIKVFTKHGDEWVRFSVYPLQANNTTKILCSSPLIDHRAITSSNGHKEHRYVIRTLLTLGNVTWEIELTLSNRDPLKFRMLLGRSALQKNILIRPNKKCLQGKITPSALKKTYS